MPGPRRGGAAWDPPGTLCSTTHLFCLLGCWATDLSPFPHSPSFNFYIFYVIVTWIFLSLYFLTHPFPLSLKSGLYLVPVSAAWKTQQLLKCLQTLGLTTTALHPTLALVFKHCPSHQAVSALENRGCFCVSLIYNSMVLLHPMKSESTATLGWGDGQALLSHLVVSKLSLASLFQS